MLRTAYLLVAVTTALALTPSLASGAPSSITIVGGTPIPIENAPHQILLQIGRDRICGGSIISATRILTAAHCVVPEGQSIPVAPSSLTVVAGMSDMGAPPPPGSQSSGVRGYAVHPLYDERSKADDVAVLELATALTFSGPRVKPIALAPVGGGPAPGTALGMSGYGAQVEGRLPDGKLYGGTLTAISDDACRANLAVNASASIQCVAAGKPAACFGDSGGALTNGATQVAVFSYVPTTGCANGPYGFADITAPEVRAFVDGATTVPIAPRQTAVARILALYAPVEGSPITCDPGGWSNGPTLGYTFVNDANGAVLQTGASAQFVPSAAHRGATVACIIAATNAGGTSTTRTGTTAAIQPDLVPPRAVIRSVRCRKRGCTVQIEAADPNSQGAIRLRVTAERRVRGRCGKGRKRHRCTKLRVRSFQVAHVTDAEYRATARRLRRGRARIRVGAVDAVGNRMRPDAVRRVRIR